MSGRSLRSGQAFVVRSDGFVLTEALAALAVTAIAAAGLLAALNAASARTAEAAARTLALREARHLLAEATGAEDPRVLAPRGQTAGLAWTRDVSPLPASQEIAAIVVEVTWSARRETGITRLETYHVLPR